MKKSLFSSEAPLRTLPGIFGELLLLSLLWFLCSVPLIAAGAASAALYDTVAHCMRFIVPVMLLSALNALVSSYVIEPVLQSI